MLGFSIYLNNDITSATEQYINRLKQNGFDGIFTSVHIPEEDPKKYQQRLFSLGNLAKNNNLNIMVDIDQVSLKKLDISLSSLDSLKRRGITGLRIDDKLAPKQIAELSQEIEIGINGSTFTEEELKQLGTFNAEMKNIQAWFNFVHVLIQVLVDNFLENRRKCLNNMGCRYKYFSLGMKIYEDHYTKDYQLWSIKEIMIP